MDTKIIEEFEFTKNAFKKCNLLLKYTFKGKGKGKVIPVLFN
jgi:hypothetical protein